MDEMMQNMAAETVSAEPTPAAAEQSTEKSKRYTLKSARTALRKMENDLEKKEAQLATLKSEIVQLKKDIREMSIRTDMLEKEETERKVHDALRQKSAHMTSTQVLTALDLVQHLEGDLEGIDIDELAKVIRTAVQDKRQDQPTSTTQAGEVATSGNFSAANSSPSGTSFVGERREDSTDGNV